MENEIPKRIHIIGSVGSGKTTFAKKLSAKLNIPCYELDNVVRERKETGDIMRTEEKRDAYLAEIIQTDSWIVEGVHHKWVLQSFQKADVIVFLDIGIAIRRRRIIKRYFRQKTGLEKANYNPTLEILKRLYNYNTVFEYERKPEIFKMLRPFESKLVVLKSTAEILDFFK
ncbi:AAA family ATPase [Metaplanococcus flavidus]|uniref:AAA family ATPase n=1 Tax=Metaplanococcus flavidus TaxID=569883 RepID=A0ABW3LGI4_9BACL